MKALRWVLSAAGVVTVVAACADSERDLAMLQQDGGPPVVVPSDELPEDGGLDAAHEADAPVRTCSDDGWCHTALPPEAKLRAVWGDGAGVVWAVAEGGEVYRWEDNAWKIHAKLDGALRAIWGSGPTDLWIGGESGLFHGRGATSAALAFTQVPTPGDPLDPIVSIWGRDSGDVWAVGGRLDTTPHTGRVLHYAADADGGAGWSLEDIGDRDVAYTHVWGTSNSGVWLAGVSYKEEIYSDVTAVRRRRSGEAAFEEVVLPGDPTDPDNGGFGTLHAAGMSDGSVCLVGETLSWRRGDWRGVSTDNGDTFTFTFRAGTPKDQVTHAVSETASNDSWAAGDYGRLRHWDGKAWKQSAVTLTHLPLTNAFHAMWRSPANELWVVGDGIAIRRDLSK